MVANNLLEVYTLIFGWNMYEAVWDVLVGSGLALIPFIFAVISSFQDNYKDGDAESTVKELELKIVSMVLVLMLCVIPYKGWGIDLATVQYNLETPDCNPPANVSGQGDDTGTAYDDAFADMGAMESYKPVAWAFVEFLSSAITHTTISSMSCVNNYEFMLVRVSKTKIQDEPLRQRIRNFYEVCYLKALERFNLNPVNLPANISPVMDIDWIGSGTLLNAQNEYYSHPEAYIRDMQGEGFNRMPAVRASDAAHQTGAHPYCREVWLGEQLPGGVNQALGLRQQILENLPDDMAGDVLQDWTDWGADVLTNEVAGAAPVSDEVKEDLLIKMILQADAANLSAQTDVDLGNKLDVEDSTWKSIVNFFTGAAATIESVSTWFEANTMKQMMKISGPMILALIQMIVIVAAPFVLLLGNYRLSAFVSIALAYFSFEFINAIWAASAWFDNRVLDLYLSQVGYVSGATNSFLVGTVSAASFILLPTIWLSIMAYAGAGMIRGMGMAGVGGGGAAGAGSAGRFASGATRLGSAAWNGYKNKKAGGGGRR